MRGKVKLGKDVLISEALLLIAQAVYNSKNPSLYDHLSKEP
jgi:hypothetical protein